MDFFDGNCFIGLPARAIPRPAETAADLIAAMDRSDIRRALVWHVAQRDYAAPVGNDLLAQAIAPHAERLVGCWTLLPPQTDELPPPEEFLAAMQRANVRALRAFPTFHNYLLRQESGGALLELMVARRVPLIMSPGALDWTGIYNLLRDFPELVCVLTDLGLWGADRWFRPLVENYPGVHVEIGQYVLAGGIPSFVRKYGASRLLFGTGFPDWDHGGMMLTLRHADISEKDKQAIAAGNLERLLAAAAL